MSHSIKIHLAAALSLVAFAAHALEAPPLTGRVVDRAGVLGAAQKSTLESEISGFEKATGGQMAVLLVDTLDGDSIEDFSIRVAEKWKIGHKGADNGLLFVAAIRDRKMRLEVGYGWEGVVNDARAGGVIRGVAAFFREKDYFGGAQYSIRKSREIITASPADVRPPPKKKRSQEIPWWFVAPIAIIVILSNFFRRRGVTYWGGGSSGGGGGFSGGGGSFGGGGASGSW